GARCAVLLAEEGRTRIGGTAPGARGTAVRRLLLPCPCCAALADLPGALSELAAIARPATIFVEVPAVAASGLLAEFDRVLGWPREVAVCLDRAWANAMRERELSPFHTALLDIADHVVPGPASGETPAAPPIHNDAA
ncbi:MAG TPA: hypothetical protein VKG78_11780, partial [Opitutaceae bacterium]|nr:hypothetical protein [Opitutaceae bacterium]